MQLNELIKQLNLEQLTPHSAYFRQTYCDQTPVFIKRGEEVVERPSITMIYSLITPECFTPLHGLKSTETFHFYAGDAVDIAQISEDGTLKITCLGNDFSKGQEPQTIAPPYTWQGVKLVSGGKWALLGCTVSPGFNFNDYIEATAAELTQLFPQHEKIISVYTYH